MKKNKLRTAIFLIIRLLLIGGAIHLISSQDPVPVRLNWCWNINADNAKHCVLLVGQGPDSVEFQLSEMDTIGIYPVDSLRIIFPYPINTFCILRPTFWKQPGSRYFQGAVYNENDYGISQPAKSKIANCEVPDDPTVLIFGE